MSVKLTAAAVTDRGRRESNEDALFLDDELGLYVVCDGVGGHSAGEVASQRAIEIMERHIRARAETLDSAATNARSRSTLKAVLGNAILEASDEVHALAASRSEYGGMATTVAAVLIRGDLAAIGHVGDSRVYLQRADEVQQLTADHTMAREFVASGRMTVEEAERSELSHVLTRTVGGQSSVIVETVLMHVLPGDTFLLCSDGLHHYFPDPIELRDSLRIDALNETSRHLVAVANERGGHDNISAVVVRVGSSEHPGTRRSSDRIRRRLEVLAQSPPFAGLAPQELAPILALMEAKRFEQDGLYMERDALIPGLHVVIHGVLVDEDNREVTAGQGFGYAALVREQRSDTALIARANTELLLLTSANLNVLAQEDAHLGNRILRNMLIHSYTPAT